MSPWWPFMMTSANGNILRVIDPLCGQWREALMFSLICAWINDGINSRETSNLRHHRAHYDVIVIILGSFYSYSMFYRTMVSPGNHCCQLTTGVRSLTEFQKLHCMTWYQGMMTSSNGNFFRVTGPLCGEFTGHRWIPHTKASDAELWCFLWSVSE